MSQTEPASTTEDPWELSVEQILDRLIRRQIRMETKLSQLMLHLGMDPHVQMYENTPNASAVKLFAKQPV